MRITGIITVTLVYFFMVSCTSKKQAQDLESLVAYIQTNLNTSKYDIRKYEPPTPPNLRDSLRHGGRVRSDSILKNLSPLTIYIDPEVENDSVLSYTKKPRVGFEFLKTKPVFKESLSLPVTSFDKKSDVILNFLPKEVFFQKVKDFQTQQGYGGFFSFRNFFISPDGTKAAFEVHNFKRRLNSSSYIVYAEKNTDGTWVFDLELLSISDIQSVGQEFFVFNSSPQLLLEQE